MKNREITVSKEANGKIQYLTEILPEIPTNTILYKKLTGLGATYGELKAHRNSIIIEPNKPVISGKCKDPKHGKDNLFHAKTRSMGKTIFSVFLMVSMRMT